MKILRRFAIGVTFLAAGLTSLVLAAGWFIAPRDGLEKSDAIVVVSGGDTEERTDEGVRLWKEGWAPKLVFAGAAADQGTSNAAVMRQRALSQDVPIDATIIEERSTSTRENAELLKPVLDAQNIQQVILVSSPYHTRRVKLAFEKAYGERYEFRVHPAVDARWARSSWWQEPDTVELTLDELGKTFYVVFLQR